MRQFSDLLAIDLDIEIHLALRVVTQNGAPVCTLKINGHGLHHGPLCQDLEMVRHVSLIDPIEIHIALSDKQYSDKNETALIIQQLSIDGFDIVPKWTHLASYTNDQGCGDVTNYLGFNGIWELKIDEPFYRWRHRTTGQGWLLEPTSAVHDCTANSANTTAKIDHIGPVDSAVCIDATSARTIVPDSR